MVREHKDAENLQNVLEANGVAYGVLKETRGLSTTGVVKAVSLLEWAVEKIERFFQKQWNPVKLHYMKYHVKSILRFSEQLVMTQRKELKLFILCSNKYSAYFHPCHVSRHTKPVCKDDFKQKSWLYK